MCRYNNNPDFIATLNDVTLSNFTSHFFYTLRLACLSSRILARDLHLSHTRRQRPNDTYDRGRSFQNRIRTREIVRVGNVHTRKGQKLSYFNRWATLRSRCIFSKRRSCIYIYLYTVNSALHLQSVPFYRRVTPPWMFTSDCNGDNLASLLFPRRSSPPIELRASDSRSNYHFFQLNDTHDTLTSRKLRMKL